MQKTICLFFLLMVCNASKADTIVQLVKPFKFDYPFKTTVGFTITNTSNSPKTFYAKTVFDTGTFDHKFLSWQDYLKDIKSEKGLIPQMNKIAYYEKSDRFKNQLLELDDYSPSGNYLQNVVDQKYSVLWFTAFSNHQCGSFTGMLNKTLIETGAIKYDSIFEVSLEPKHQVSGFILNGDSAISDPDANEPLWLTKNFRGKFEWIRDFKQDKNHLRSSQHYSYCDPVSHKCGLDLSHSNRARYQTMYNDVAVKFYPPKHINNVADSSLFRLPPNSTLSWRIETPGLIIDTSVASVRAQFDSAFLSMRNNVSQGLNMFSQLLGISVDSVSRFLMGNFTFPIVITNGKKLSPNDLVLSPWFGTQFEFTVHINPSPEPIIIGTDFMLPGWVHQITTNKPVTIGGTTFPIGTTRARLYVKNNFPGGTDDNSTPVFTPCAIQSGTIPANTTVDLVVSYNQLIYGFPNGLKAIFWGSDKPTGLVVTQYP